jgi:hypothetical protein
MYTASLQHRETGLHKEHQESGDQHPHDICMCVGVCVCRCVCVCVCVYVKLYVCVCKREKESVPTSPARVPTSESSAVTVARPVTLSMHISVEASGLKQYDIYKGKEVKFAYVCVCVCERVYICVSRYLCVCVGVCVCVCVRLYGRDF